MPVEAYRIWYSDGSWWDDWDSSPDEDVQIVMLYHPDGYRTIIQGEDEYWHPTEPEKHSMKLGRWMTYEEYEALVNKAMVK